MYVGISIVLFILLKGMVFDTQLMTVLNKALMITFVALVTGIPLLLISKKNRKKFAGHTAIVVDDFIFEILEPLKLNSKRKEFWILEGYAFTRLLTTINKVLVIVYVLPAILVKIDSSKATGIFLINLVVVAISVETLKFIWSVLEGKWRRAMTLCLYSATFIAATGTLQRIYNPIGTTSIKLPFENNLWAVIILIACYILLLQLIKKLVLNSIEKDLTIFRNPHFDQATFGIPSYSFEKYRDLIKIQTIDFKYEDLAQGVPNSVVAFVGSLRYGLVQFEMVRSYTRIVKEYDTCSNIINGSLTNNSAKEKSK